MAEISRKRSRSVSGDDSNDRSSAKGSGGAGQIEKNPLKTAFGDSNWGTFIDKMPNWENDLTLADFNTIYTILDREGGIEPTAAMAKALVEHFKKNTRPASLRDAKLIQFTKCENPDLTHLEVYRSNIQTPIGAASCYAVRHEYELIFEKFKAVVEEKNKHGRCLLILGNSGIGKSVGLNDLLRRVLGSDGSDGSNCFGFLLIVVVAISGDYVLFRKSVGDAWKAFSCKHLKTEESVAILLQQVSGLEEAKKVLLLHDVKSARNEGLRFDAAFATYLRDNYHTTVVVASSPNEGNYRLIDDELAPHTNFWCECWRVEEARELWSLYEKDAAEFDDAFFNMGGVPRHLLNDKIKKYLGVVEQAMSTLSYETLRSTINTDVSHCIAMAVPNGDRTQAPTELCTFVSKGVECEWRKKRKEINVQSYRNQYELCIEGGLPSGTCGDFFERLVLACLLQSSTHPLGLFNAPENSDTKGTTLKKSESYSISITSEAIFFSGSDTTAVTAVEQPSVFVPTNQQFPFVDFLIVYPSNEVTGIQSTVNQRHHRPTPSTVEKVLGPLEKKGLTLNKIVWAVPSKSGIRVRQNLDESKVKASENLKEKYSNIDQYLLLS